MTLGVGVPKLAVFPNFSVTLKLFQYPEIFFFHLNGCSLGYEVAIVIVYGREIECPYLSITKMLSSSSPWMSQVTSLSFQPPQPVCLTICFAIQAQVCYHLKSIIHFFSIYTTNERSSTICLAPSDLFYLT